MFTEKRLPVLWLD